MKYLIFNILCLFIFFAIPSWSQSAKQWENYGDLSYSEKDYYGASIYYSNALITDSLDVDLLFKYSESLRQFNNYEQASIYYAKLVELDKDYRYPDAVYWLALMQQSNGEYNSAGNNFRKFASSSKDKESFYYKKSIQAAQSCEIAPKLIKDSVPVIVKNIGEPVNSENADFASLLTSPEEMIFSSLRAEKVIEIKGKKEVNYQVKLYKSSGIDSTWKAVKDLDTTFNNTTYNVANGSYSPDGKAFYFTGCSKDNVCGIYSSQRVKGKWGIPILLDERINLPGYTNTQPSLSIIEGREILLFVSNRPGGVGKLDIWYSARESKDKFAEPINLGSEINTIDDEVTPWYQADSSVLYFSSGWHYGLGGFDIFRSKGNLRKQSTPENIGYPLNSGANDFYYSSYGGSKKGFLSSNRKGSIAKKGETCCNDIWFFAYKSPEPLIAMDSSRLLQTSQNDNSLKIVNSFLPLSLYFHNDEPSPRSRDTVVSVSYESTYGKYLKLEDFYKNKYSRNLNGGEKVRTEDAVKSFFDEKVRGGHVRLNDFLERLLSELQKGRELEIAIKGYASPLAENDYNINLSKRRISTFVNQLKDHKSGVFNEYLKRGKLVVKPVPFGESKADSAINDKLENLRESVYSPEAALERKIEILYVIPHSVSISYSELFVQNSTLDFGTLKQGRELSGRFKVRNIGNKPLQILGIKASCGCTAANTKDNLLEPGEEGEIEYKFDSRGKFGVQQKEILIENDGIEPLKVISLKGIVTE